MSEVIPVVKVVRKGAPGGYVEINASDQTSDDVLYKEPTAKAKAPDKEPAAKAPAKAKAKAKGGKGGKM